MWEGIICREGIMSWTSEGSDELVNVPCTIYSFD